MFLHYLDHSPLHLEHLAIQPQHSLLTAFGRNISVMKSSCTFWSLSMGHSLSRIQLSVLFKTFEDFFDLNCSTGPVAMLKSNSRGSLHILKIPTHIFFARGILLFRVSLMLAAVPSSCIWLTSISRTLSF